MALSYGAQGGLGEGLMMFGQMMNKQILDKKLREEREASEKQREDARERRAAEKLENTVTQYQTFRDRDGVTWMQGLNAAGAPKGERRLASQFEIEQYNRNEEDRADKRTQNQLALDKLRLGNEKLEREAGYAAEDRANELALNSAKLDTERAQAESYRSTAERNRRRSLDGSSGTDETGPTDQTGFARQLLANNEALVKSYTTGANAQLTQDDVERIANSIVGMAADRGANNDWIQRAFREALTERVKTKTAVAPAGKSLLGN